MNDKFQLLLKISKLRERIEIGYGLTHKPIPEKRLESMKRELVKLESELEGKK